MRKQIILAMGIFMATIAVSQPVTITENFDGNIINFNASPAHVWERDTNYYASAPAAYLGMVPNNTRDVAFLETPLYNMTAYNYVLLRFKHICKISPQDIVRLEYRIGAQAWRPIPAGTYMGNAENYGAKGFSAASYNEWEADDSLAFPSQSWWKEELFDISFEVGGENDVQFRFVIEHGTVTGTQISYGWLLDDVEINLATYDLRPPAVEFVAPFVPDTVFNTGPHTVKALVESLSDYPLQTPWLVYTSTFNGVSKVDSVEMTPQTDKSFWSASIPAFVSGTTVIYSITGRDMQGNYTVRTSGYLIAKEDHDFGDHSIELVSIDSPLAGQTVGNAITPVIVTIRNKGDVVLTSATIYRSINGVITTHPYIGSLDWDMTDTVHLGIYTHRADVFDTIIIWVSSPNIAIDPVLSDDTLKVISYGCPANMSGNYTVGVGGVFPTVDNFLNLLKNCPPSGNITLLLKTGVYNENWNLSNLGNMMNNYTLTITSEKGNKDSVTLKPTSGNAITLANSNHLVIKDITVEMGATSTAYAISFTDACTNIVIRDCRFQLDTTSTTNQSFAIYKASNAPGIVDNLVIINNIFNGGYWAYYVYAGRGNGVGQYGTNVVFDSNTLTNQYYGVFFSQYTDHKSISYNTIRSRVTNAGANWRAIFMTYCNASVVGNSIIQRSTGITTPFGINFQYLNYYNTTDTGLVANNEIRIYSTNSSNPAIYVNTNSRVKILHNSIYVSNSTNSNAVRGIYIASNSSNYVEVKNNNIVVDAINSHPIYLTLANYIFLGYNNMWSPTYVGYAGGNRTTMQAWRDALANYNPDPYSINIRPQFIDSSVNLELYDYSDFHCEILPELGRDIQDVLRLGAYTSMGAYHGASSYAVNATLQTLTGYREGSLVGQSDNLNIQLRNTGTNAITSFTLNCSINGNTPVAISYTQSIPSGEYLNLTPGSITYVAGDYTIKAWLSAVNGSSDEFQEDDTLTVTGYICSAPLSGICTIGASGMFPSGQAVLDRAALCGVNGDVTLDFQSGTHAESFNLSNNTAVFGNHTLTLTSTSGNAILTTQAAGIILSNSNNIVIKGITIDATAGTHAIQFTDACTNIVIRDCKLLANPTVSSNYYPIYKASSTGVVDSIFIINNLLDGGYSGCHFEGGTGNSAYGRNIVFDSNTVSNNYYCGFNSSYNDIISCSYNTISSRTANVGTTWYGILMSSSNAPVIGNRIIEDTNRTIATSYGIYLSNYNYYNTLDTGLVANNEVILHTSTGTTNGISLSTSSSPSRAKVLHNSVYIDRTGNARGIRITNSANDNIKIKNNNIVIDAKYGYPIYLEAANPVLYDIDYNNMYAPTYTGYTGIEKYKMSDWQETVTTDRHSTRLRPTFVDSTLNLELVNYVGLACNLLPEASVDIDNIIRGSHPAMGCYSGFGIYLTDALLKDIQAYSGTMLGTSDTVSVILVNTGTTPLTDATLTWSFNGVTQSSSAIWQGVLAPGAEMVVVLGMLTYAPAGDYTIKAWIQDLGYQQDMFSDNDTTQFTGYICSSPMNGIYRIGQTEMFKTITDAVDKISICGISGDVTFEIQQGTYNEIIDLRDISLLTGNYTLTFTSPSSANASDVRIVTDKVGFLLSNSNNIRIKGLTVDATKGNYAIQFATACSNVVIRDCRLLVDTTVTVAGYAPISKEQATGVVDSIFIINNLLDGGYDGCLFNAGTGTTAYGANVVIDSNIVTNQYRYAINPQYVSLTSCSYNTILSRTAYTTTTWRGMYLSYANGPVISNRIKQRSDAITQPHGIYLQNYNRYLVSDTSLVANNEIITHTTGTTFYGIYANAPSRAKILHNSIYVGGTVATKGLYLGSDANTYFVIKHNNIVLESSSSTAYPISFSATTYLSSWIIDANNYYAPSGNVAYAGSVQTLAAWKSRDKNAISVPPAFIDNTVNLQLNDYTNFGCPSLPEVPLDITGEPRIGVSAVGAYHGYGYTFNGTLTNASQWGNNVYAGASNMLEVKLTNTAMTTITSADISWSFNGISAIYHYTGGSLTTGQSVTIQLGMVSLALGNNTLEAWVDNWNGSQDDIGTDDSIHLAFYTCSSAGLSGTFTIGTSGMFSTIEQALIQINLCTVTGDITLALQPGSYTDLFDLSNISIGNYTLTFTSANNNADEVTIIATTGNTGILLSNNRNIIIEGLTIDLTSGRYGVRLNNSCDNIIIRNCKFLANTMTTTNTNTAIDITSGNDIHIYNNEIEGGYSGIALSGGTNVLVDSNYITNTYYYGVYASGTDFTGKGIAFNTIEQSRTDRWHGIYLISANGDITGNRIYSTSPATGEKPRGIFVSRHNANSATAGLIANNEIFLFVGSYTYNVGENYKDKSYGIKTDTLSNASIIHNSIYMSKYPSNTAGAATGIEIDSLPNNKPVVIKNNNIYMTTGSSVIYNGAVPNGNVASFVISLPAVPAQYNIDYNNMYMGSSNIASIAGNAFTLGNWRQEITTDIHSVSILPVFVDTTVGLRLSNIQDYLCPFMYEVPLDINGTYRGAATLMGAYTGTSTVFDVMLQQITRMDKEVVVGQNVKIGVEFINTDSATKIDSVTFRYSLNGVIQPDNYTWIAQSPLTFGQLEETLLDSFNVSGNGTIEVIVWIETVNGIKDLLSWNDTLSKTLNIVPLARFAEPFIADTINALSFDLYVNIMEKTGALLATPVPKMEVQTTTDNGYIIHDTIEMQYNSQTDLWEAHIPQQYYGSTVSCSLTVADTIDNEITLTKSVYLDYASGSEKYTGYNLSVSSIYGLVDPNNLCSQDYVTISATLVNLGAQEYDFTNEPVYMRVRVTTPNIFSLDTLLTAGSLPSGDTMSIDLTNMFPIYTAGQYDIKVWLESMIDNISYDDTLLSYYVSGKIALPVDEDFSGGVPLIFDVWGSNSVAEWKLLAQGIGADSTVVPQFGDSLLSFTGSRGSMSTFATRQMDLSRTEDPLLTFWYFHDTLPSKDYTDVRITVDGGTSYTTLLSLTKYNPVYGWKQYEVDLPGYVGNQCVILTFEAMEKSNASVTQYIDRIRITAKQDIAVTGIIISEYAVCDLQNKEVKVILSNLSDPVLNYGNMPTTVTLEIQETNQTFTRNLTSGMLDRFSSDTITVATIDFTKGTYTFKAYFSSVLDTNQLNDTLEVSIIINPSFSVSIQQESGGTTNCLTGELVVNPTITLYNTGNMDLSNIDLILQVDTGDNNPVVYALFKERYTGVIHAGDTATYTFTSSYSAPWNARYEVRTYAYLSCDSTLVNSTDQVTECVNTKDLRILSIDNPSDSQDSIGKSILVTATLNNRSDVENFNVLVTVLITDLQGAEITTFTENETVGLSSTVSHTFTSAYTVPNDSAYYLTVFVNSQDDYSHNDTMTIRRKTIEENVSVKGIDREGFILSQNIPNPAKNRTRIDYSIPEAGEVIFHVHSVSGQLLYSKTIEAAHGKQSLELNTSSYAAGIYFYSIEYKGQRLVKRMMIND
jgi:hypothetical protein